MRKTSKPVTEEQHDLFTRLCSSELGVECVREYRFHPTRRWRFDYAIPSCRVAIEIDGGIWTYGRHNRASGYLKDLEKFNTAAEMGWLVLKFTPKEKWRQETIDRIKETVQRVANAKTAE